MASDNSTPKSKVETEMEEGEIVDELDDLSDISSEEEFLLRQRLEVLESYNNVLERKKAKRSTKGPGTKPKRDVLCDLSEVSATELEDPHTHVTYKKIKIQRYVKPHNNQKRRKDTEKYVDENSMRKKKDYQKKKTTRSKKRLGAKVTSDSDESEDEYRNKRKKLADAVVVPRAKNDKSSLSARLYKMIHGSEAQINSIHYKHKDSITTNNQIGIIEVEDTSSADADDSILIKDVPSGIKKAKNKTACELIEVSDDEGKIINDVENQEKATSDETGKLKEKLTECQVLIEKDSDDDLALLRQHALESKPAKSQAMKRNKSKNKLKLEDEDSDTAELRVICLKSAILKKVIEMKQKQKKQKKRKKLSKFSTLEEDLLNDLYLLSEKIDPDNNTDTESVDMDMGSESEEKLKDCHYDHEMSKNTDVIAKFHDSNKNTDLINCAINNLAAVSNEDELDDDEDLLRAKLLTSLSKNLTNLVSPELLDKIDVKNEVQKFENPVPQKLTKTVKLPEAKKFIIKLGESDSEAEHEATKNLTKMHMKLSEQIDFQQKLDQFLKSTRKEVEKTELPDNIQNPPLPKKPDKFVAKAVNHLPKSEQIEYKNLVRRMTELEKIKQTRQATINFLNQPRSVKDTLKQRNVTIDATTVNKNLEELIAKSRKTIAEESAKMLKLKEEARKLSQRHKIAATEFRNITTAINLNKKQQRAIQICLSKIRSQHQSLLKSSTTSLHSKVNGHIPNLSHLSNKVLSNNLQEENFKDEFKDPFIQKTVKVCVVNDYVDDSTKFNKLSKQVDVANNKAVKIPNSADPKTENVAEVNHSVEKQTAQELEEQHTCLSENNNNCSFPEIEKELENVDDPELVAVCDRGNKRYYISFDDYKSPLEALGITTWQADPNAILCPFEVGGQCKDPDCKYVHTPNPEQ